MQQIAVDASSLQFPRAVFLLVGSKAIETVCEDRHAYDDFIAAHARDKPVRVRNECRFSTI